MQSMHLIIRVLCIIPFKKVKTYYVISSHSVAKIHSFQTLLLLSWCSFLSAAPVLQAYLRILGLTVHSEECCMSDSCVHTTTQRRSFRSCKAAYSTYSNGTPMHSIIHPDQLPAARSKYLLLFTNSIGNWIQYTSLFFI